MLTFIQVIGQKEEPVLVNVNSIDRVEACDGGGCQLFFSGGGGMWAKEGYEQVADLIADLIIRQGNLRRAPE